jgi:hypothetical protein
LLRQGKPTDALDIYSRVMNDKVKSEEIWLNYIEVLFINNSTTIAERRIKDLTLTSAASKERLAELERKYLN